ncbi:MAG: aspartate/glutamate racemase family protein [Clostridia bacterium]|nr:aspartate/glutamate racemase family protein [Clostridia bacterium]
MNEGCIAVLDSGVGGISVLNELIKLMPNERYLYFGDNENAPYGNRTKTDLAIITFRNIDKIMRHRIKALVIGCNTISTTILDYVSDYAGVPTFGVFPPIESTLLERKNVLLLSTVRTAKEYEKVKGLSVIGFERLAGDIESNLNDLSKVDLVKNINNSNNVFFGKDFNANIRYETIILGCTHYFFIKKQIIDHFRPQNLIGGNIFTAKTVFEFLKTQKSLEKNKQFTVEFIGKYARQNENFFKKSGQKT